MVDIDAAVAVPNGNEVVTSVSLSLSLPSFSLSLSLSLSLPAFSLSLSLPPSAADVVRSEGVDTTAPMTLLLATIKMALIQIMVMAAILTLISDGDEQKLQTDIDGVRAPQLP